MNMKNYSTKEINANNWMTVSPNKLTFLFLKASLKKLTFLFLLTAGSKMPLKWQ